MSEYIVREIERLKDHKVLWLTKLGQSVYYQYRIGQIYSDELKEIGDKITELDQKIHSKLKEIHKEEIIRCVCGNTLDVEDEYCGHCGKAVEENQSNESIVCEDCNTEIMIEASFCYVCGSRLQHHQGGVL
ncbi:zinc ribbon domain-containing protein [Piscibacillus halophilus]|uniref:zinc ribbon domain-containing protein n=1 Tax=Piscibacillus halophilus TaxID=571933 RepID=UPI001589A22F|nr:zinc ribbon domain-containing protein [Piscibacillus halophilus]